MDLSIPAAQLMGFSLAMVRTTAWIAICPPFNSPAVPKRVRVGLATAISLLIATQIGAEVQTDLGTGDFILTMLAQAIAGLALGFGVFLMFQAIQAAGELIDLQVGFALGAVLDPLTGTSAAPIGRFHQFLAITILFVTNGHTLVIRGYLRSVEAVPLGGVNLSRLAEDMLGMLGTFLIASLEIGLPVLAALFIAEIALGLLGKAAPQMNILVIGFAAKSMIAFLLLAITVATLPDTVDTLIERGIRGVGGAIGG